MATNWIMGDGDVDRSVRDPDNLWDRQGRALKTNKLPFASRVLCVQDRTGVPRAHASPPYLLLHKVVTRETPSALYSRFAPHHGDNHSMGEGVPDPAPFIIRQRMRGK